MHEVLCFLLSRFAHVTQLQAFVHTVWEYLAEDYKDFQWWNLYGLIILVMILRQSFMYLKQEARAK